MTVTAGVASIKGTYTGEVALTDQQEPRSFLLTRQRRGRRPARSAPRQVRLAPNGDGGTELSYDADAVVGGMIAASGSGCSSAWPRRWPREFFAAVDDVLTGREALAPVGGGPAGGGGRAGGRGGGGSVRPRRGSTSRRAGVPGAAGRTGRLSCAGSSSGRRSRWPGWPSAACWGAGPADADGGAHPDRHRYRRHVHRRGRRSTRPPGS